MAWLPFQKCISETGPVYGQMVVTQNRSDINNAVVTISEY